MYESESEDELVGNIIKVFVTSKDNPKKVSKEAKKYIIPKILASDFNFGNCFCKNPILSPKPLDSSAPDLFESFGFKQLIDIPT